MAKGLGAVVINDHSENSKKIMHKVLSQAFRHCLREKEEELGVDLGDLTDELTTKFIELLVKSQGGITLDKDLLEQRFRVGLTFSLAQEVMTDGFEN
jgi:hypothetical protein